MKKYDILIIGSGLAGVSTALELSEKYKIALVTKKKLEDSNSYLAQGGINVLRMNLIEKLLLKIQLRQATTKIICKQ